MNAKQTADQIKRDGHDVEFFDNIFLVHYQTKSRIFMLSGQKRSTICINADRKLVTQHYEAIRRMIEAGTILTAAEWAALLKLPTIVPTQKHQDFVAAALASMGRTE